MAKQKSVNPTFIVIIALFVVFVGLPLLFTVFTVVEDGQAGVVNFLGKISDTELGSGLHFKVPLLMSIEKYNVKTEEIKESVTVPSNEGLIVELDVSLLYKLDFAQAAELRKSVGAQYREILVEPFMRNIVRDVVSGYEAKDIYSQDGRAEVASQVKIGLQEKLEARGIIIEDVLLRDVKLPEKVTRAIELKLEKEQEAQRKEFELEAAKKDAEIEIERAKGAAQANQIVAQSITEEYIQYLWVQSLHAGNNEIIYVPTEANLPILEATRN